MENKSIAIFLASKFKNESDANSYVKEKNMTFPHLFDENLTNDLIINKKFKIPLLLMINDQEIENLKRSAFINDTGHTERELGESSESRNIENSMEMFEENLIIDKNGYIGCFLDNDMPARDLLHRISHEKMVPEKCKIECGKLNHRKAMLGCSMAICVFVEKNMVDTVMHRTILVKLPALVIPRLLVGGHGKMQYTIVVKYINIILDTKDAEDLKINNSINSTIFIPVNVNETFIPKRDPQKLNIFNITEDRQIQNLSAITQSYFTNTTTTKPLNTTNIKYFNLSVKSKVLTTMDILNFSLITTSPTLRGEGESYICFILLKQPWKKDFKINTSTSYKIFHGNFVKAMKDELKKVEGIFNYEFIKFIPNSIKLGGIQNRIQRAGVYFRIICTDEILAKNDNPITLLQENIFKSQSFGGMPVFASTFKSKSGYMP
ncbi:hypothetical protein MXB_2476 [Myxobolus squamalis]|nr:hypothetical protein MXB_2476 [Myxobolus squamalis]